MNKIAVITDTDSSLPSALAEQHGIRQVPITINFNAESYTTGVDIDDALLFEKVDRLNQLPTTSAPSPGAFSEAYESAFQDGADSILSICVSSDVSATYAAARTACENFPGRAITVLDSRALSMGQGFMALIAAEAARDGAPMEQIVARVRDAGGRIRLYAVLSTLKYLALSGRVGKVAAGLANTLNIKPLLTMENGKLEMLEKIRTRRKAVGRMLDLTRQSVDGAGVERAAIIHVNNPVGARELEKQLREAVPCPPEILIAEFTPGLSVHAGSGVVGLVVVTGKN